MKRAMGCSTKCLMILLGCNLLCCDAAVTVSLINSANGVNTLECRSDGVVSCRINPYAGLITWVINGTLYATCAPACSENPSFTRNYTPAYDTANGVFNLTVGSATFNDNDTTFKCDDGSVSDDITVEVVPAYSEFKTSISNTDGGKQVEFTTACVQPGVEFEWFTVKTDNSDRKTYNKGQNETTETSECPLDSDCGGIGTVKCASVIMISTVPTLPKGNFEEKRYIEVVVKYKNPDEERTFRFDETFLFIVPFCEIHCFIIIPVIYVGRWFLQLALYLVAFCWSGLYQNCMRKNNRMHGSYVPIIGTFYTAYLLLNLREGACLTQSHFPFPLAKKEEHTSKKTVNETSDHAVSLQPPSSSGTKRSCAEPTAPEHTSKKTVNETPDHAVSLPSPSSSGTKRSCAELPAPADMSKRALNDTSDNEKRPCAPEHYSWKSRALFAFCCITDTVLLVLMILTCTENIEGQCYIFVVYGCCGLVISMVYALCLAECLQKDNCICSRSLNKKELYCLSCQRYLCKSFIKFHTGHRILRHCQQEAGETRCQIFCNLCEKQYIKKDAKYYSNGLNCVVCEGCTSKRDDLRDIITLDDYYFHKETNVESYCLKCQQYLCTICFTKHAKHRILRHSQQGANGTRCQISCNLCKEKHIHTDAKYYSYDLKSFVCVGCMSEEGLQDIISICDYYFHSQNDLKSYCLSCQQYVCTICFTNHADHNFLRHSQQGKKRSHIFCKFCLKKDIRKDAKYYSKDDKCFVCEDCKSRESIRNIIAVDDIKLEQQDQECEEGCKQNKIVECYCMKNGKNMCAACLMSQRPIETPTFEQANCCALHSVAGFSRHAPLIQNAANKSPADVLCLVCNLYLCKICFEHHLDLKKLWRMTQLLDKKTSRLTTLLLRPGNEQRNVQTTGF